MDALFKFMHPRTKHIQHATTSIDYEELRIWHLRLRQQARCEQLIKARCVSSWLVRISCHRHSFCQEVYARPVFYSRWRKKFLECLLGLRRLYYTLYTYVHKPLRYSSMSFTFETKWQRMWKDEEGRMWAFPDCADFEEEVKVFFDIFVWWSCSRWFGYRFWNWTMFNVSRLDGVKDGYIHW